jgi:hypothetical protein
MGVFDYVTYGLLGVLGLFGLYLIYKIIMKLWLKYQSTVDRSYNVFDKAEFSAAEKMNLKRWAFTVPETLTQQV